jgi:hypothetical protein
LPTCRYLTISHSFRSIATNKCSIAGAVLYLAYRLAMESLPARPTLPLDVTDMITDLLHDDKPTLADMSLVCRAFCPRARRYLFETLTVYSMELEYPTGIEDLFTSIAPLARSLIIRGLDRSNKFNIGIIEASLPKLTILKDITSVTLQFFCWRETEDDIKHEIQVLSCFHGLLELSLVDGIFPDTADIIRLALQFPVLEQLRFEEVTWGDSMLHGPLDVPSDASALSSLRSVAVCEGCSHLQPILGWFLSLDTIPPLHSLQINTLDHSDLESATLFIRALGPSLRHLKLGLVQGHSWNLGVSRSLLFATATSPFRTEYIQSSIDLSQNENLHSLHLDDKGMYDVNVPAPGGLGFKFGDHIPVLISQVKSLEELTITIVFDAFFIKPEVWITMDRLLDQPQFSNLQRITFNLDRFCLGMDIDRARYWSNVVIIKKNLPLCHFRRILLFT